MSLYSKGCPPGMWGWIRRWNARFKRERETREKAEAREQELAAARERLRREQNERSFEKKWGRMF